MRNTNNHRSGISRPEVALLVFLALMVVGFSLVFLSRSWDNSHRVVCSENLKNIGEACRRYQERKHYLPSSSIDKGYATWAVQIAPYLSKTDSDLLTNWDESLTFYDQPEKVRTRRISTYFCPSRGRKKFLTDPGAKKTGDDKNTYPGLLGDYACSVGTDSKGHSWTSENANGAIIPAIVLAREDNRILKWKGQITLKGLQALRGTENTVLVGEKHVPFGKFGDAKVGDGSIFNGDIPGNFSRIGGQEHPISQNATSPYRINFGSYHKGVCPFVMADTSIRWMNDDISATVLGQLTNRFVP